MKEKQGPPSCVIWLFIAILILVFFALLSAGLITYFETFIDGGLQ